MGAGDRYWMGQALALAALGDWRTAPNPRVGCVIVRDGSVVGAGYHARSGEAHAEGQALQQAGARAEGGTAYVNLEPCAHTGMTPPCAGLLIDAGVRRVVAALQDPNPRVNGRGFQRLRDAGVNVDIGVQAGAAERLNAPFITWQRHGRPLVSLKAAMSLDGLITARDGCSRWITGDAARAFAQRLRREHDAVLVGAGTVREDDPRLTARLAGEGPQPLRVVLSQSLELPADLHLWCDGAAETRIYTAADELPSGHSLGRATIVKVPGAANEMDLGAVLADLANLGIRSVLVEGGATTFGAFLRGELVDRAYLFVADKLLGAERATPLLRTLAAREPAAGWSFDAATRFPLGDDWLLAGRLVRTAGEGI